MEEHTPLSLKFITGFSVVGLLFSGYFSIIRIFSASCALNEGCTRFLGFSACYYGFVLYVVLTTLSILALRRRIEFKRALLWVAGVAFLGVLFAGYLVIREFVLVLIGDDALGVLACIVGLVFYMLVFATAALGFAYRRAHEG